MSPWIVSGIVVLAAAWLALAWQHRRRNRQRLLAASLTPGQRAIVERLVPLVKRLPPPLRAALEGKMNLFLDQVTFRGYNGISVTEEMRLSIAAQACLLVMNSPLWYDSLRNVLIYPAAFFTDRERHDGGLVHGGRQGLLGESWTRGPVVLSWDDALRGGLNPADGHNVVIHEFAHQLDALSGHVDGIPILRKGQRYAGWERAMLEAYEGHVRRLERGEYTLIDPYGATNHQEFFAEAIVTFFEKPQALRSEEPALYDQLGQLLGIDPAQWA